METGKGRTKLLVSLSALVALLIYSVTGIAGNLQPGGPPAPTMKTLNEVEPRVPIHASDLPLTITEPNSYYLVEDVYFTSTTSNAISIECNDVTIDLMGYTLKGPDSGGGCGIRMVGRADVEVRNGTVRDFYYGVLEISSAGRGHRIINLRALSNTYRGIQLYGSGHLVKDCAVGESGDRGICSGDGSTVTGNTVYDNGAFGIYLAGTCTVTGNTTHNNSDTGICAGYGSTVSANTSYSNKGDGSTTYGHGILAGGGCTVIGNTAYDNNDTGIYASSGCTVAGNTAGHNYKDGIRVTYGCKVTDNTCYNNGIGGNGAGIHVLYTLNRIDRNSANANNLGIDVDGVNNLIVKNSAAGNTTEYDIVGGNKVGTISTDPTTAGPWDNFDF
jgi:parallel beta-helix repeat protein